MTEFVQNADVAFVINSNYIGQFKVTLNSLILSNVDLKFTVHLLNSDLTEEEYADIKTFTAKRNCEIEFYKIDENIFSGLPKMSYDVSYTAYYKVLLPYYLNHLKKVLFLDCDIIVRKSIKEFYEKDHGKFLTCVEDYKINRKNEEHKLKIIGDKNLTYFNSGVMLFDFSKSEQIAEKDKVLKYIAENSEFIRWHDQDILNHFYAANCCFADEKYNYLTVYKSIGDLIFPKGKKEAVIVHYANWKPWRSNYIGKCYGLYKKNYKILKNEKHIDFLKRRSIFAQIKLIFGYIFR